MCQNFTFSKTKNGDQNGTKSVGIESDSCMNKIFNRKNAKMQTGASYQWKAVN